MNYREYIMSLKEEDRLTEALDTIDRLCGRGDFFVSAQIRLGLSPSQALILSMLHRQPGRVVAASTINEAKAAMLGKTEYNHKGKSLHTLMHQLRNSLEAFGIDRYCITKDHGTGYMLTTEGRDAISRLLVGYL